MNDNNILTPALRFPGFSGDWSVKLVKDLCDINTGKSNTQDQVEDGKYPFYIRSAIPVRSNRYLYDCEAVITIGDGQIGKVFHYVSGKFDLHQRCYMMSNFKGINPRYFYYFFSGNFYERAMRLTAKATVDSVRLEMISDMPIFIPPTYEEQNAIASLLTEIDHLISTQEQKVESLKAHKKGLLQQLFPQPGATIPALRFPGFSGEWQFVNGDELFRPISNKNHNSDLPILALTQDQGAVPREMINYNVVVSDKSVAGYKVVEVDDFIISLRSFQGGIEYSRYKGLCSPAYIVIRKIDKTLSSDFYRIYFKSFNFIQDLNRNLEGIRDGKMISYQQFSEIKLPLPSVAEQTVIANCISSLENVILLESQKLDSLKEHKKGLMQQFFPQFEK